MLFAADAFNATFTIPLTDDHVHENNETFSLTILPSLIPPSLSNITVGVTNVANVMIEDNDRK